MPVNVPVMETMLPFPMASSLLPSSALVFVLLRLSVAPFVASVVPLLLNWVTARVSGAAEEFALMVPLLVSVVP